MGIGRLIVRCAAMLAVCTPVAQAGSLRVMPVRVEVAAGRQFCSLTLGNDAARPMAVQVRGFAWTRDENGADTLDPANGPVVNPAITTIPPGGSRLVRCSLPATPSGSASEQQWRLIVDELPSTSSDSAPGTVQTLLRLSVPVFRTPEGAQPELAWSVTGSEEGGRALRIINSGKRRAQVLRVVVRLRDGREVPFERGFYLLADGAVSLPLPAGTGASVASVVAETDLGSLAVTSRAGAGDVADVQIASSQQSGR